MTPPDSPRRKAELGDGLSFSGPPVLQPGQAGCDAGRLIGSREAITTRRPVRWPTSWPGSTGRPGNSAWSSIPIRQEWAPPSDSSSAPPPTSLSRGCSGEDRGSWRRRSDRPEEKADNKREREASTARCERVALPVQISMKAWHAAGAIRIVRADHAITYRCVRSRMPEAPNAEDQASASFLETA